MKDKFEIFNGKEEVKLTDDLIKKLVSEKKWKDEKSLKEMAKMGAKWNIKRNSLILNF